MVISKKAAKMTSTRSASITYLRESRDKFPNGVPYRDRALVQEIRGKPLEAESYLGFRY